MSRTKTVIRRRTVRDSPMPTAMRGLTRGRLRKGSKEAKSFMAKIRAMKRK